MPACSNDIIASIWNENVTLGVEFEAYDEYFLFFVLTNKRMVLLLTHDVSAFLKKTI